MTHWRVGEGEDQRVTDGTSWILLGMSTETHYQTMTMENRKYREVVIEGDGMLL